MFRSPKSSFSPRIHWSKISSQQKEASKETGNDKLSAMFISYEILGLMALVYGGVGFLIWKEYQFLSHYADQLQRKILQLKSKNTDLKNHNEVLQTRYDLLSEKRTGLPSSGEEFFDDDITVPTEVKETVQEPTSSSTIDALADKFTSIKNIRTY